MRVVTIGAAHLSSRGNGSTIGTIQHRMRVRQAELASLIQMALETDLGRFPRIDNRVIGPARLTVKAARAVARFAADVRRIRPLGLDGRMGRCSEALRDLLMALHAIVRADERGSGYRGRNHHSPVQ